MVRIAMPALRDRDGDMPFLINALIADLNSKHGTRVTGASASVLELFRGHSWPGNVRELRNVLGHALILAREGEVAPEHLPLGFGRAAASRPQSTDEILTVVQDSFLSRSMFGRPLKRRNWPKIFVLMPFLEDLRPVYDDHIRPTVERMGLTCQRADDFMTTHAIIQEIWSAIVHAEVVIADCTGRNPNVFYEIGIAHTLGKNTLLITQDIDDVPFDLRHLRIIEYQYTPKGVTSFEKRLTETLHFLLSDGSH
jgi:hypothetical protein